MSNIQEGTNNRQKRRQSIAQLRRLSAPAEASNEDRILIAAEESLISSRKCYRAMFLLAGMDLVITLIDESIWGKILDSKLGWVDYVEIFDSTTLLISALSIWHAGTIHEERRRNKPDQTQQLEDASYFFNIMYWIWGISAINLALVSLSIASALPTMGIDGPFHTKLIGSGPSLTMIVATIIVLGYSIITNYCTRAAIAEDKRDSERINQYQKDSKNEPHFKRIRETGYQTHTSLMLCAGSSLLYSFMELSKWLVADKGLFVRGMMLFDILEPFAVTILIMKLSKAYLCMIPIHREWSKETFSKDSQILIDYINAFTSFYEKRADVVNGMIIARVFECLSPYVIPYASVELKNFAPTLYERVFG